MFSDPSVRWQWRPLASLGNRKPPLCFNMLQICFKYASNMLQINQTYQTINSENIWFLIATYCKADDCGMVVLHARHTRTTRTTHIGRCRLAISPMSFQGRTSHHCWPYRMDPIWSCWPYFSSRSRLPDLSMALSGGQHQQSVAIHVGFVQIDLCWGATRHLSDLSHQLFHGLLHSKQISTLAGCEDVNLIDLADDLKLHEEPETKIDHETHQHTHQDDTVIRNLHLKGIPRISICHCPTDQQWHGNHFQ